MYAARPDRTTTSRNLAWGKTGHMMIGYCAAGLVDDPDLARFLKANQASLGVSNPEPMNDRPGPPASASFVPLADVADLVWRTSRPQDEANHFCDIDESDSRVHEGRSLIELCLVDPTCIDVDFWLDFDRQMDRVKPNFGPGRKGGPPVLRPRRGALPFRVWQMYLCMISALRAGDLTRYLAAGGTMAHYVGDASQPLHCSWLHHGSDPADHAVHADYETVMVDRFSKELAAGVYKVAVKTSRDELIGGAGIAAARAMLMLMNGTLQSIPPQEIVDVWRSSRGPDLYRLMWKQLGQRTIAAIAAGAHAMAMLWGSAWQAGNGQFSATELHEMIAQARLKDLYDDPAFLPSIGLDDPIQYKKVLSPVETQRG